MATNRRNMLNVHDSLTKETTISKLISSIPQEAEAIIKSCKNISQLIKRQHVSPKENLDVCLWLINVLKCNNCLALKDILETLYSVLKKTIVCPSTYINSELMGKQGILWNFIHDDLNVYKVQTESLKCLQALITCQENSANEQQPIFSSEQLQQYAKCAIKYLFKKRNKDQSELNYSEAVICACKILVQIYTINSDLDCYLNETIGACKYWMVYGLGEISYDSPKKVSPSQQTVAEVPCDQPRKGGKCIKLRKPRNIKTINICKEDQRADNLSHEINDWKPKFSGGYVAANFTCIETKKMQYPLPITSESDISDSENNMQLKLKSTQAKIRLSALSLLSVLIKATDKHVIFGYWWALLPDVKSDSKADNAGLALCITQEHTKTGRMAALTALLSLLTACRPYLIQADTSKHLTVSFTPFSVALGITIESIHELLCNQLAKERSVPVIVNILKCIAAIVQASPYNKLGVDFLLPIIFHMRRLIIHKDWTVQVAALIVMGCIISINPLPEEVLRYLENEVNTINYSTSAVQLSSSSEKKHNIELDNPNSYNEVDSETNSYASDNEELEEPTISQSDASASKIDDEAENSSIIVENFDKMCWLLETCLKNLGWTFTNGKMEEYHIAMIPTRLESLQVLSVMSLQNFDHFLAPYVNVMLKVLSTALEDNSAEISLHAAKCISSIGDAMQKSRYVSDVTFMDTYVQFWTNLLRGSLTKILQSELHPPVRAFACDCIGSIGENIFVKLSESLKILSATLLLGSSGDEDVLVRAAAVRALAVCIMYRQWREDVCLVTDCSEMALRVMTESSPAVRVKATWALANITDALILNMENPEVEFIDNNLFIRLLKSSIIASNENDKIKMSAMRALGNILFLMNESLLENQPENQSIAVQAIDRLKESVMRVKNMKVRWNACHALGKALKNLKLYVYLNRWQETVLECLCELIYSCRNLKVCTHASMALCSPTSKYHYGTKFIHTWTSILKTLNNAHHTEDFTEYKHKNQLIEQLCVTLSHLTCLLTNDDLLDILNPLCFYWEIAAQLLQQVAQRCEPQSETCQKLLDATKYVTTELQASNEKQKQSLSVLQNMFICDY